MPGPKDVNKMSDYALVYHRGGVHCLVAHAKICPRGPGGRWGSEHKATLFNICSWSGSSQKGPVCNEAVGDDVFSLVYVPDWFVTQQLIKSWHDNDDY